MRAILLFITCICISSSCGTNSLSNGQQECKNLIEQAANQLQYSFRLDTENISNSARVFPRSLDSSGDLKLVGKRDWTSGFYPGVLWLMYELTGENSWKNKAARFTELLESEKYNDTNHDIGFKMMCSFGNGYRLTGNDEYREVLIQSAYTLITRFNEKVGCIRSWDHHTDKWDYPVIIDNMMNLELLLWAWEETGDSVFYNVAVKHAETTMKNHFRNDYSSYHVVSYDTLTGNVQAKNTRQGFSDESAWARGQAWALYGYTMVYRETRDPRFLKQAEKIANYIMNIARLPDDFVPYWDFDAPDIPEEYRDASAAAIMASALYELATFSDNNRKSYINMANHMVASLSSDQYFSIPGTNHGFLLTHSTGSKPGESEVDVPLIYADYYYLEALKRKQNLTSN